MGYDDRDRSRSRSRSPKRDSRGSGKETGTAGRWNERGFGFIKPTRSVLVDNIFLILSTSSTSLCRVMISAPLDSPYAAMTEMTCFVMCRPSRTAIACGRAPQSTSIRQA